MKRITLPIALFAASTLTLAAGLAGAAEIRVLTPGGASPGVRLLAAEFIKENGTQVAVSSTQPMIVRQKVLAGEPFDVIVQSQPALDETEKAGLLFLQADKVVQPDPDRLDEYQPHAGARRGHWPSSPEIAAAMLERYSQRKP